MSILINEFFPEKKDWLIENIKENASRDQSKAKIRLEYAQAKVWQPFANKREDFEPLRHSLIDYFNKLYTRNDLWIERGIWGLIYDTNEGCIMHDHGKLFHSSAILYLKADPGCANIVFEDGTEIEPKDNMLLIFPPTTRHGVLPSYNFNAQRICIAMNVMSQEQRQHCVDSGKHTREFYI